MPNTSLKIQAVNLDKLPIRFFVSHSIPMVTCEPKEGPRLLFIGFGKVTRHVSMDPAMSIAYSRKAILLEKNQRS